MSKHQRILIADDDPDIIEQVTLLLKQDDHEVAAAESCAEAEQLLMTFTPDLAIIDLIMEQQDSGFTLCHEIKRLYPGTPVILLTSVKSATGISFAASSAEARSWVQADRVIDKPVRPEQLKAEVRRLLRAETAAGAHG